MEFNFDIHPLGDNAVILQLDDHITTETHRKIQRIISYLEINPKEWITEFIPAFTTVAIFYDPVIISSLPPFFPLPYDYVCTELRQLAAELNKEHPIQHRVVEIPVCYGGEFGPDLNFVADYNEVPPSEVIRLHSSNEYLVHMIGFAPGFPYISGIPSKITAPRKETPRQKIPAGSVGIAGEQTGVYPIETPGGWQIIGRTPAKLFRPNNDQHPTLLKAGDTIKFSPINLQEYYRMEEKLL
jgi:inhibitor of KinA